MPKSCKTCFYWRGAMPGSKCCNYMLDTGKPRPASADGECQVHKPREQAEMERIREKQKKGLFNPL